MSEVDGVFVFRGRDGKLYLAEFLPVCGWAVWPIGEMSKSLAVYVEG